MSSETPITVKPLKVIGGGSALAHVDGETWMVSGALPGELVQASVQRRRRGIVEAQTIKVLSEIHPARDPAPCPDAATCGGCDWPHVEAFQGVRLKADAAADASRNQPVLRDRLRSAPINASPLAYRLRSRLHWDPATRALGFFGSRSRSVVPLSRCRIISDRLSGVLPGITERLADCCPSPVDVEWLEDLRGKTCVAALRPSARGPKIHRGWVPECSGIDGLLDGFHYLDKLGHLQNGWGSTGVTMDLPLPLWVPIGAFFQVNRHLVPWLFDRIAEFAGNDPLPTWDLHAGVGFLAAAALHAAKREIVAIEPFRPSARAASRNLPSASVHIGCTAEQYLKRAGPLPNHALVLIDPPRAGLSKQLRHQLISWRPQRILGLACDPATWARDTAELMAHDYDLTHLELIDLFPSTHHVEVLYALESR